MRHGLVRALVLHYLAHFGYAGPRVRIFTTPSRALRELERKRSKSEADERDTRKDMGWTCRWPNLTAIYVNAEKHDTLGDLLDTCAHEALHATGRGHTPSLMAFEGEVAEAVLA